MTGHVFNIQRFSIHDGPGIRTTVFLKGCTLRCFWCHNPEGLRARPELQVHPERCIACGACIAACEHGANPLLGEAPEFQRERCVACGRCAETCYAGARTLVGAAMTVEAVVEEASRDRSFYDRTGGGVTLSGGEPLLQDEFAHAILQCLAASGIHTAVETAANVPWAALERVLPVTGLFMLDLKHMDPAAHERATGVTNERILENVRRLAALGAPMLFRTPVVPGVNDAPADIGAIAAFAAELGCALELLPFHRMAGDKYRGLGMPEPAAGLTTPSADTMQRLAAEARSRGIDVTVR